MNATAIKNRATADDIRAYQYIQATSDSLDNASRLLHIFQGWLEDTVMPKGIPEMRDYLAVLTTAIKAVNKANRELGDCAGKMYMELDIL